jgi:hypothetical protein
MRLYSHALPLRSSFNPIFLLDYHKQSVAQRIHPIPYNAVVQPIASISL